MCVIPLCRSLSFVFRCVSTCFVVVWQKLGRPKLRVLWPKFDRTPKTEAGPGTKSTGPGPGTVSTEPGEPEEKGEDNPS